MELYEFKVLSLPLPFYLFFLYNEPTFYSMYMRFLHECVDVQKSWHQK